jgi:hypothetical protein
MSAAKPATFQAMTDVEVRELYGRIIAIAEKDPSIGAFDDDYARAVSERMVDFFGNLDEIEVRSVEERIQLLFRAAIEDLRFIAYQDEDAIIDAKTKTEEALREAHRSVSSSCN